MRHPNEPSPRTVVVFRALPGLGDMLCLVPALRSLRRGLPDARITLLGLPSASWMPERLPELVDELLEFPGFPGIPEVALDPGRTTAFLDRVRGRFDLALQLHGSGIHTNPFVALLGARRMAGSYLPSLWCPAPGDFLPYRAHEHEVRRLAAVVHHLGMPEAGEDLRFPVGEDDREQLRGLFGGSVPGPYVVVHPGASDPARRWPASRFAGVADGLARQGLTVVVTGTHGEREVTASLIARMAEPAVDLTGLTTLGSLAALLERAELLICNDTGVSHLASALGTRSVTVFITTEPERWAPLDAELHRVVGPPEGRIVNACLHTPEIDGHRCLRDGCNSLRPMAAGQPEPTAPAEVLRQSLDLLAGRI